MFEKILETHQHRRPFAADMRGRSHVLDCCIQHMVENAIFLHGRGRYHSCRDGVVARVTATTSLAPGSHSSDKAEAVIQLSSLAEAVRRSAESGVSGQLAP